MLRYSFLEMIRNKKRSILLFVVSLLLSAFTGSYFGSINNMELRLNDVYQTIPVTGEIAGRNLGTPVNIPYDVVKWILDTGFIKSCDLQIRDYAFIIDPLIGRIKSEMEETWPEIIGIYSLDKMPWYNSISIEYADGYSEESFQGSERICLISESDMSDKNIQYGDQIRILASNYYKKYNSLAEMGGVLFTVCGQFSTDGTFDGKCDNLNVSEQLVSGGIKGDILVPVDTLAQCIKQLYDDDIPELELIKKTLVSHVEFDFLNTRNLKDFRTYLSKTDFARKPYEVKDERLKNLEFRLYDDKLNEVVTPLTHSLKILTNAVWLILSVMGLIAFFIAYLALKACMEELWVMRSVGNKTYSILLSLMVELSLPCIISSLVSYLIGIPLLKQHDILPFLYFPGCYTFGSLCFIGMILLRPINKLLREK